MPLLFYNKCVRNVIEKAVKVFVIIQKINFTIVSKFRAQQYEDTWPTKVGKPWREKGCTHGGYGVRRICKLRFIAKGNWLVNSRDVNPLETIWIIVDETTYKDTAPKTLDELRQWLRFAWENVCLDTLLGARTFYASPLRKYQKT